MRNTSLAVISLLLATTAISGQVSGLSDDSADQVAELFYLFLADDPQHLELISTLQRLVSKQHSDLILTGVMRTSGPPPTKLQISFPHRILDSEAAAADPGLPSAVLEFLASSDDFALLAAGLDDPIPVFSPSQIEAALSLVADLPSMPTEVQENTWGKIKLFFN